MLDYVSAGIAFYSTLLYFTLLYFTLLYFTLFPVQEWLLEFRLGYLGRYWSLIKYY
jgi:hypothetical protein